jgi:hypothetical protein
MDKGVQHSHGSRTGAVRLWAIVAQTGGCGRETTGSGILLQTTGAATGAHS